MMIIIMEQLEFCVICGNAHEGSCSTEAIYFYWIPEEGETVPYDVYIVGDWSKWAKKEKMNRISTHTDTTYFSISLALNQGPHEYKYIVDGMWRHDQNSRTVGNSYGELNNYVEILPKKSYLRKHQGELLKITSDFCIQNLKIIGSWDDWTAQRFMNLTYNPLKKCEQNAIYLDLQPNQTYQFKFKHGSQYFVDQKYPTVVNSLGTLNNLIVVYNKKIEVQTPNNIKIESCPLPTKNKHFNGKFFSWKKVQQKINLPYERVQGHSMCSVGEYLYVFGGKSRSQFYNTLLKINLSFDKVQSLEVYPDGRAFHAMKAYGNKIIIYGGSNKEVLSDYQVFNVSEMKWHSTLNIAKISAATCQKQSCVIFQSLLIFFGGCYNTENSANQKLSDQIQVLDLQKMQWIQSIYLQGQYPPPRFAHTAEILNTDMYIFGGVYNLQNQNLNDIWRINLTNVNNLRWVQLKPTGTPPQPRHGHTMNHLKDYLIVFGGINDQNELLNDVFVYGSTDNQWIKPIIEGQVPRPRFNHAAVSILDSQIILFGGKSNEKRKNNQFLVLQASQPPNFIDYMQNQDKFLERYYDQERSIS